jgi:hypothetical protein
LKKFVNFCLHYIADLDIPVKRFVLHSLTNHIFFFLCFSQLLCCWSLWSFFSFIPPFDLWFSVAPLSSFARAWSTCRPSVATARKRSAMSSSAMTRSVGNRVHHSHSIMNFGS